MSDTVVHLTKEEKGDEMYRLLVSLCGLMLAGCTQPPLKPVDGNFAVSSHKLSKPYSDSYKDGLFHMACTDSYKNGHFYSTLRNKECSDDQCIKDRVELARSHFEHAAMANNVYKTPQTKPTFAVPGWTLVSRLSSESGLDVDVYLDAKDWGSSKKATVVYRGTDFYSLKDWKTNFAISEPLQFKQAFDHLYDIRNNYPSIPIVVVGHSLGGAIALNMAARFQNVEAVAFNPSPRAFFAADRYSKLNKKTILYERGEVLDVLFGPYLRMRLEGPIELGNYNLFDYKLRSLPPVQEHGIYEMTRALTVIAMTVGDDEQARRFFVENVPESVAKEIDWENCASLYSTANRNTITE
ncbi:alpha/beta fold hydrolase [Massilia sp. CT11-108]|uniref:alpha/beta fold hydrolase n=1 Tax=Massilia sp. CT11-108 TaxID=3393900 RepID=UPI0039A70E6E